MIRWTLLFLGIFLFLYGLFALTNFQMRFGDDIKNFCGLLAGIVCLANAFWLFSGRSTTA